MADTEENTEQSAKQQRAKAGGAARWAGKTPEQRSTEMRRVAAAGAGRKPFLAPELRDTLLWVHENRDVLQVVVERMRAAPEPAPEGDYSAYQCSVCLSVLTDLDKPCPTCIAAGRMPAEISSNDKAADIETLQRARAAVDLDSPTAGRDDLQRITEVEPTIHNTIRRAPLPAPPPPARAYSASETCLSCGRLAELHMNHGGPIQHHHEPQPPPKP